MKLQSIFDQTDFVHASGTKEELQVCLLYTSDAADEL